MQTIKTGVVVALLLAVCYGAFVALNAPDPDLPASIEEWASGDEGLENLLEFGMDGEMLSMESAVPVSADQFLSGFPTPDAATGTVETPSAAPSSGAAGSSPSSATIPSIDFRQSNPNALTGNSPASPSPFPDLPNTPVGAGMPANFGSSPSFDLASLPNAPTGMESSNAMTAQSAINSSVPSLDAIPVSTRATATNSASPDSTSLIPPLLDGSSTNFDNTPPDTEQSIASGQDTASNQNNATVAMQPASSQMPTMDFATARTQALEKANRGELKEALEMLSPYFQSPELGYEQSSDLVDILDALSREVIYSSRHILEPAYTVASTDTVASVAKAYNINPEFLSALNGFGASKALVPGAKIKVIRGPFNATVNLTRGELTLFLGNLYAGRFPISVGKDPMPREGVFAIVDRQTERTYYGAGGFVLQANNPRNPFGGYWLNLGDDLCIHGTPEMASSDLEDAGCISLAPLDAKDVYSILAKDCRVEIRR